MRGEREGLDAMIDTKRLAGFIIVASVICFPLLTWLPMTTYNSYLAVGHTPYWMIWCLSIGLISCWVGEKDGILGLIVGYTAIRGLFTLHIPVQTVQIPPHLLPLTLSVDFGAFPQGSLETMLMIALGAIVLVSVQCVPQEFVKYALWTVAGLQIYYLAWQMQGMDPIWNGFGLMTTRMIGTLGQENYVGVVLGMILPLTARLVWIPSGALFYALSNVTGVLSMGFGLLRRYGLSWRWIGMLAVGDLAVLAWAQPLSLLVRMRVWNLTMRDQTWWTWIIGHGWGSWALQIPSMQEQARQGRGPSEFWGGIGEHFFQAHNELVQMYYEGGLLFLFLCGLWMWSHRRAWEGLWGGAALAVLVSTFGFFTFHTAIPGLIGLVIIGTALSVHQARNDEAIP